MTGLGYVYQSHHGPIVMAGLGHVYQSHHGSIVMIGLGHVHQSHYNIVMTGIGSVPKAIMVQLF